MEGTPFPLCKHLEYWIKEKRISYLKLQKWIREYKNKGYILLRFSSTDKVIRWIFSMDPLLIQDILFIPDENIKESICYIQVQNQYHFILSL